MFRSHSIENVSEAIKTQWNYLPVFKMSNYGKEWEPAKKINTIHLIMK